jgi:hypothetical protein
MKWIVVEDGELVNLEHCTLIAPMLRSDRSDGKEDTWNVIAFEVGNSEELVLYRGTEKQCRDYVRALTLIMGAVNLPGI